MPRGYKPKYVVVCEEYRTKPTTLDVAERDLERIETFGACRYPHRIETAGGER